MCRKKLYKNCINNSLLQNKKSSKYFSVEGSAHSHVGCSFAVWSNHQNILILVRLYSFVELLTAHLSKKNQDFIVHSSRNKKWYKHLRIPLLIDSQYFEINWRMINYGSVRAISNLTDSIDLSWILFRITRAQNHRIISSFPS